MVDSTGVFLLMAMTVAPVVSAKCQQVEGERRRDLLANK